MKAIEIVRIIEEFAPEAIQESWDNSGLAIGDLDTEIKSVLLALDCTPEIIDEAISTGSQMIITHHPLIFKGIRQISSSTLQGEMITSIIKNNLIIYSAHTNADKVMAGVSGIMAERLGLRNIAFLDRDPGGEYGMGVIGDLETPLDFSQVLKMVRENFNPEVIKCSKPIEEKISRIALCGGSGSSLMEFARDAGAQLFITGDVSYHFFFCEKGFMLMDIGHYESEYGLLELLKSVLTKKISTFAVRIAEKNTNPIHYY
ncbi:MAG: Nif3-like dinuclear metal center hexameric protein [Bacteroidetes bacterium GWF2_40_14]|nr:MAG: Nif3-like dinuclear metal center hexameric protein [Bacteroidetes bacterium GWF2_40_14]